MDEQEPQSRPAAVWKCDPLWHALEAMQIEPRGAALTFTARLARENGWTAVHAAHVFGEYRRFLYLAATANEAVTPSDNVDQAWHLHLSYSRHYWDVLCARLLKRPLHHGPTAGGEIEGDRHRRQYGATLRRYRSVFGSDAPAAVWPEVGRRFSGRAVRIDCSRYWLVPKALPSRIGLAGGAALIGACSLLTANGGASDGGTELALVAVVLIVAAIVFIAVVKGKRHGGRESGGCGTGTSSDGDCNGCGGGCGGD